MFQTGCLNNVLPHFTLSQGSQGPLAPAPAQPAAAAAPAPPAAPPAAASAGCGAAAGCTVHRCHLQQWARSCMRHELKLEAPPVQSWRGYFLWEPASGCLHRGCQAAVWSCLQRGHLQGPALQCQGPRAPPLQPGWRQPPVACGQRWPASQTWPPHQGCHQWCSKLHRLHLLTRHLIRPGQHAPQVLRQLAQAAAAAQLQCQQPPRSHCLHQMLTCQVCMGAAPAAAPAPPAGSGRTAWPAHWARGATATAGTACPHQH